MDNAIKLDFKTLLDKLRQTHELAQQSIIQQMAEAPFIQTFQAPITLP
ncbi:MAG: hypothetical protein KDD27_25795 [Saprospiraceae bacterium]|nr:hypothetical protein [Saprospiraceae bacterium]